MEKCTFSSVPFKRNGNGTEKKKNGKEKNGKKTGLKHGRAREHMMRKLILRALY